MTFAPGAKVDQVPAITRIGPWSCLLQIDTGGNATVWRATRDGGSQAVALKVLNAKKQDSERYQRFVQEVEVLRSLGDVDGVLPVIEAYLPDPGTKEQAWLAMPIATPVREALADASVDTVVEAVGTIARTLARLQEEHQIGHRDVKPGNLYELDGKWLVGDFGLVDVPGGDDLTKSDKALGPANFTAYEVIVNPKTAASGPADVYSLGKTLWVLGTGQLWPALGHQSADESGYRLSDMRAHPKAVALDRLIDRTTLIEPSQRPTMAEVAEDLASWERLTPDPVAVDLSPLKEQLRKKLAKHLAAQNVDEQRKQAARAAMQILTERVRPLNDQLRELYPQTEVDLQYDQLTQTLLSSKHLHWGVTPIVEWMRTTKITINDSGHFPFSLRMARSLWLLPNRNLHLRWLLFVGPDGVMGQNFSAQSEDFSAPVGSVQQQEMIERFVFELRDHLPQGCRRSSTPYLTLNRCQRPAEQTMQRSGPIFEHLERLGWMAREVDPAHVIRLRQLGRPWRPLPVDVGLEHA